MGPGTLYGSIKRMLADGFIEESDERPDPALDDQRRRYYRITDVGRRVAGAEAKRLSDLVSTAREKWLLGGSRPFPEGVQCRRRDRTGAPPSQSAFTRRCS